MAPKACAAAPRAPHIWLHVSASCRTTHLLPHVRMPDWSACKMPHQYTHVDQHASVACAETPRAWSIHLVLLHVRRHVLLPCTVTPRASGDNQLVRWLTPRSEPMQRATSSFLVSTPPPSSEKRKTSDKENLPYFRIWKSLTYSNRLRPALRILYKGNLNPRARDPHFET
ncbi:hypothetical protein DY000_02039532 [Brassica cretica]|uniref:Uncharacterized protein n=1 Tax=Brassica cretica TaxID=69181 RepID=A0ABQ7BR22_BRACR|nr:hypothetical protein DY000_02039532 [Brassica cretica]